MHPATQTLSVLAVITRLALLQWRCCNGAVAVVTRLAGIAPPGCACFATDLSRCCWPSPPGCACFATEPSRCCWPSPPQPHPDRPPTAAEFLNAYSFARGYMNARGAPDISRGARWVIYAGGYSCYTEFPPRPVAVHIYASLVHIHSLPSSHPSAYG